jgi:hypothetical protein
MRVAGNPINRILVCALLAGAACAEDERVVSREAALASTASFTPEGGGALPSCADIDLRDAGEIRVREVAANLMIVEVNGTAVCQGTEAEVEDALGHVVFDPDEGTPLPSIGKDDDPPLLPGTPLPSAY